MNDAGRIGFIIRGDYKSDNTYDFLDIVYYNGASYVAKKFTSGNVPVYDDEYWHIFAMGGISISGDVSDTTVTFSEASDRTNLSSGDKTGILFGKIKKWLSDLKSVAFSGSYNDLSNKPTALKNPNAVTIKASGTSLGVYDGSAAKEFNITASNVGAVASGGAASTNTVAFTTGDTTDANAAGWTSVPQITSGSTFATLFTRVSTMMKNARYLYKLIGTTDISAIGGGTVTGAIAELNTGLKEMTSADDIIDIYENNYDLKGYGIKCGVIKEIRFNLIVSLPYNTWKAVAKIKDKYFFPNFMFFSIFSTDLGNPVALQINADGTISLYAFSDAVTGDQLYITVTYI